MIAINLWTFLLYGIDKRRAIKRKRRISENTLLFFTILGGFFGASFAMIFFKHKLSKPKFYRLVPALYLLSTAGYIVYRIYTA